MFLVPMFSQFLFRDPCSSKVFLLFLKKRFFIWDRHIYEQAGPLLVVFHYYVWFVCLDFFLSVWTGMSPSIVTALFLLWLLLVYTVIYWQLSSVIFPLSSSLEDLYLKLNDEFNQKLCDPAWIQI